MKEHDSSFKEHCKNNTLIKNQQNKMNLKKLGMLSYLKSRRLKRLNGQIKFPSMKHSIIFVNNFSAIIFLLIFMNIKTRSIFICELG